MTRPEHVRCENCCFWSRAPETKASGVCQRLPEETLKIGIEGCGEFRKEWPE